MCVSLKTVKLGLLVLSYDPETGDQRNDDITFSVERREDSCGAVEFWLLPDKENQIRTQFPLYGGTFIPEKAVNVVKADLDRTGRYIYYVYYLIKDDNSYFIWRRDLLEYAERDVRERIKTLTAVECSIADNYAAVRKIYEKELEYRHITYIQAAQK